MPRLPAALISRCSGAGPPSQKPPRPLKLPTAMKGRRFPPPCCCARAASGRTAQEGDELAPSHECPRTRAANLAHRRTTWASVHRSEICLLMSVQGLGCAKTKSLGQNENRRFSGLCQLPPAADMPLNWLSSESCQCTKSLRDSCGVWRALSDIHRGERVSSGGSGLS